MGKSIFFDSWQDLLQIAVTAPIIYAFVVLAIRVSGKRATSQMNNFDWIVTVAIGSIAGSGIMLKDLAIAETVLAIALLLALQWLLTKTVLHNKFLQRVVKAPPTLLVHDGQFLEDAMRRERITRGEIRSALRDNGLTDVRMAQWVILEPDASFSVITKAEGPHSRTDLEDVQGLN
jgi:uncharacterized membrane protein YcaP (DUF421 family)